MIRLKKIGISPVVATVLLIAIALVLVLIIFTWAKTWVKEKIQKDVGGEGAESIENFCDDIRFTAEAELIGTGRLNVNNIGIIPLYGIEVRKQGIGSVENIGAGYFNGGLIKGSGKSVDVNLGGARVGDEFIVVPIILGETDAYRKPYTCDEEFAEIVKVV